MSGAGIFETFQGAQHGDRRRDRPVAVQERCTEKADRDDADAFAMLDAEKRHQRQYPALPVIVRAHDHCDVFE